MLMGGCRPWKSRNRHPELWIAMHVGLGHACSFMSPISRAAQLQQLPPAEQETTELDQEGLLDVHVQLPGPQGKEDDLGLALLQLVQDIEHGSTGVDFASGVRSPKVRSIGSRHRNCAGVGSRRAHT
jgi:hypothetical protein